MDAVSNRLLAAPIAALLGSLLEQKLGIKLTDEQLLGLVSCAPVLYHILAAIGQKTVNAFVMYFPPKQLPVNPAKD